MIKMKLSKALKEFVAKVAQEDHYWVERAKLEFSADLERHRRLQNLSGKDLAEKIGTSPAYISKVFRGDSNFTCKGCWWSLGDENNRRG
jgi:ribosome-binding protein aMBF1 (putative translation factor)